MQQPSSLEILRKCEKIRQEMLFSRCKIYTAYLYTLRLIEKMLKIPWGHPQIMETLRTYLEPMYDQLTVKAIMEAVRTVMEHLKDSEKGQMFLHVMKSPWMKDNA